MELPKRTDRLGGTWGIMVAGPAGGCLLALAALLYAAYRFGKARAGCS